MQEASASAGTAAGPTRATMIALGGLGLLVLYCYWNSLAVLVGYWQDPQYSQGWLVPVFALVVLWMRWQPGIWQPFHEIPQSARWWGVGLLAAGLSLRLVSAHVGLEKLDIYSLLPSLAGVVLLVGGWRLLAWSGPVVAFLFFMFPLPYFVEQGMLVPLQKVASIGAEYLLQTLGYGAYREGNVISVGERRMQVIEACAGLRMLTVFLAMTATVALVTAEPYWQRTVIFLSAVPIAVAANIGRITTMGMALHHLDPEWSKYLFDNHETVGLLMMVPAMGLLYLEMVIFSRLFVADEPKISTASPLGAASRGSAVRAREPVGARRQEPLGS